MTQNNLLENLANMINNQMEAKDWDRDEVTLVFPKAEGVQVAAAEERIGLPEGVTLSKAAKTLIERENALNEEIRTHRNFNARIEDLQVAVKRVMEATWGTTGRGRKIETFFGTILPSQIDVVIGLDERGREITEKVPASEFTLAPLEATVQFGTWQHEEFGICGRVSVTAYKKYEKKVTKFLQAVEAYLATDSIYKGKVVEFKARRDGEGYTLSHRNVKINPHIVYNSDVQDELEEVVFDGIEYYERYALAGEKNTFNTLLKGPYGTGKTECAITAAVKATEHGWTTVFFTPSERDSIQDLEAAFNLANLYGPSLLVVEDIDRYFLEASNPKAASAISNLLDGANSKTGKVSILMTTNHFDKLPEVATRHGRMDAMIEIGYLDREAMEKMFYLILGDELEDDVDFDPIYEVVQDTGPSFIRGTFALARKYAIASNKGELYGKLSTQALLRAARRMKNNSDLHKSRQELSMAEQYVEALKQADVLSEQVFGDKKHKELVGNTQKAKDLIIRLADVMGYSIS